jgi:Cof subfamily protein (haloacid dehalogenase superfamily)
MAELSTPAPRPQPRMIAFDIDGTLLPSSSTVMSARTVAALRAAHAAGIQVVIATGRRHAYATPIIAQLDLPPSTLLISSNGAVSSTLAGLRLERSFLDVDTSRALCSELRAFGGTAVFTFDRQGRGELVLESLARLHERVSSWVAANLDAILEVQPLERAFDDGSAPIQGMVCGTVAEMSRARKYFRDSHFAQKIATHCTEYLQHDLSILDILPYGCSKASALSRAAARAGIAQAGVMAVGDNWNDLEMLGWAGEPVLMGNASPDLLARAAAGGWTVAPTNDEDGVAQMVEEVLRRPAQHLNGGVKSFAAASGAASPGRISEASHV